MKQSWWIGGLAALWRGAVALGACGNPCDDLQMVCDQCTDATYGKACKNVVALHGHSLCVQSKSVYLQACPAPPPSASSSSGVTAGSGSGGTSASASASSTAS